MFLSCLKNQTKERNAGQKVLTSVIYKDNMKSHSKYADVNEAEAGIMGEDELQNLSLDLNTSDMQLMDEEQDEDMPDEKLESQLKTASQTIKRLKDVMIAIDPIIHDLREGNLVRKRPSTY